MHLFAFSNNVLGTLGAGKIHYTTQTGKTLFYHRQRRRDMLNNDSIRFSMFSSLS
jgi:hypothetical protein